MRKKLGFGLFMPILFSSGAGGEGGNTDAEKEAALKVVKEAAIAAANKAVSDNIAKLLKAEFGTEEAKAIIKEIATAILPTLQIKESTGKETALGILFEEMQKQHDALSIKFNEFKNSDAGKSQIKTVLSQVIEHKEAIKKAWKSGSEEDEVHLKALTNRASVSDNAHALDIPGIGQLATRKLTLYDLFPKIPVGPNNNGVVRYYDWDEATTLRAAAMRAEGDLFPESTAKWKTYVLELKKVGDSIPMTEEFLYDDEMFAAELEAFLRTNVDLVVDTQIAEGDGTGNNLTGIKESIEVYVPSGADIQDASIYDLIPKVVEDIVTTRGSKYQPNIALMNRAMINKYKLKKDANNNYILPPFVSRNGQEIDGVLVIESNVFANNEMVIGDSRFARIYEQPGIFIGRGMVGNDFLEDKQRLKVRRRLLFLIRKADVGGWLYVDDIDASLVELEGTTS